MSEALKAITVYGAYQYHEEGMKGTIAVGKYADFVVLDENPLEAEKESLADIKFLLDQRKSSYISKGRRT